MGHHSHRLLLPVAAGLLIGFAPATMAETPPPQAASPRPSLPQKMPDTPVKLGSPVIDQMMQAEPPALVVHKQARRPARSRRQARRPARARRQATRRLRVPRDLDRPALAGIELVAPLPLPGEPPHITVPAPAFPLDSAAARFLTPPPPIVCHPVPRERGVPDPHLYREVPVACEADNP